MTIDKFEKEYIDNFYKIVVEKQSHKKHTVLIVDDEDDNLQLLRRTLRKDYNILTATSGVEALNVVKEKAEEISLIISDYKMPVMTGTEFLEQAAKTRPEIVNMLLTGHSDLEIVTDAVNKCNLFQYIVKPFEPDALKLIIKNGIETYELSANNHLLVDSVKDLFYTTIKSISAALDARDAYTHGHSLRVTLYSLIMAEAMGIGEEGQELIETMGLLHDIGKIGIPDSILNKPGRLTEEEFEVIKTHPEQGKIILKDIKKLNSIAQWLACHHERWDGRGYPYHFKGEQIPFSARIVAIADTYDAMTSDRSYRKGLPHEVALGEIQKCSGSQFDPSCVAVFVKVQNTILAAKNDPDTYYEKYSRISKFFRSLRERSLQGTANSQPQQSGS